jgi:UDP-3-O-[3-hydroxymyristoyl] glucosamine N-acyltransferase
MNISLSEIASLIQGVVVGDSSICISTLSPIENIKVNSLVFAEGKENLKHANTSEAAALLVSDEVQETSKPLIQVREPYKAFIKLLNLFYPETKPQPAIHATAVIAEDAIIGNNVYIGPYVIIESGSKIGDGCVLKGHVYIGQKVSLGAETCIHPHVTIYDKTKIGERVVIHASTVIGSDGFGYKMDQGKHVKMPHIGIVVIEDDVEIGANSVIDRATMGETFIGEGTKVDNLVQIAHSVKLGKNNILCAFTGIAGSTTSGDNVIFAANVGVSDHVRIDDGVILGARTGVPPKKHLKQGNIYLGNPARPKDKAIEQELAATRIPIMRKNLRSLQEKIAILTDRLDQKEKQ